MSHGQYVEPKSSHPTTATAGSTTTLDYAHLANYSCRMPPDTELGIAERLANGESPEFITEDAFQEALKLRIPVWIFTLGSMYITAMLIVLAIKKNHAKQHRNEKHAKRLMYSRLAAACFTVITLLYYSFSLFLEASGLVNCAWFGKTENALYWLNISIIYVALWLRQRVMFNQPNLRHLTSRVTSFLSYSTIVMVFILPVFNSMLFSMLCKFCYHPILKICTIAEVKEEYRSLHWAGEYIVPILVPLTLLALFSYPLYQHHRQTAEASRGQRSVLRVLRRITLATLICLATDLAAVTCNGVCDPSVSFVTRRMSLFGNLVCMVACFSDARDVLFPRIRKRKPGVRYIPDSPCFSGERNTPYRTGGRI